MTRPLPDLRPAAPDLSACSGASPEALGSLDRALFRWHRMALKGEMTGKLLADLGIALEPAQLRALIALGKLAAVGEPPTVGRLAEELGLDPSRASRIAGELIARGYLTREAAQDDGRKSILVATEAARRDLDRFGALRRAKQAAIFADWPAEDVAAFARLLERYAEGVARVCRGEV